MFDASEILFLDCAVRQGLLTAGQRARLLEYTDLPEGMRITRLVIDAGLMVEDEVQSVLDAISRGIGSEEGVLPSAGSSPEGAQAATRETLDAILNEEEGASDDVAKALASAVRVALHEGEPPLDASYHTFRENREAAQQAFPMPQGASGTGASHGPAFPLPAGAHGAMPQGEGAFEGFPHDGNGHGAPDMLAEGATPPVPEPEKPLQKMAISTGEIDSILGGVAE